MPVLGRRVARTAAIVGTATAVSGLGQRRQQGRRQQGRWAARDQASKPDLEQAALVVAAAPVAQSAPAVDMDSRLGELKEFAAQKEAGVLTDAHFDAEKAMVLNS